MLLKSFILVLDLEEWGDFFLDWEPLMLGKLENANFINIQLFRGCENSVLVVRFVHMVFSAV